MNRSQVSTGRPVNIHGQLNSAVSALDWAACEAALATVPRAQRKREVHYVLTRLLHSGAIVVRRANGAHTKRRDAFVANLIACAKRLGERAVAQRSLDALETARIFDEGYRSILDMLSRAASRGLSPAEHAWALLEATAQEHAKICQDIAALKVKTGEIVDLYGLRVSDDQGTSYRPDAVVGPMVEVLSSSLLMLGYRTGWFTSDDRLEVPAKPPLTDEAISRASATLILGNSWRVLATQEEHWRFFNSKVGLTPAMQSRALQSECRAIDCAHERGVELLDRVADERLTQLLLRVQSDLMIEAEPITEPTDEAIVPLPPTRFLNNVKRDFVVTLESTLHVQVLSMTGRYGGLSFAEWVRGYSFLQSLASRLCATDGSSPPHITTARSLEAQLARVGLNASSARTFLSAVTFSKIREDLFDAPLVRSLGTESVFYRPSSRR
jgi:hypothetical protein